MGYLTDFTINVYPKNNNDLAVSGADVLVMKHAWNNHISYGVQIDTDTEFEFYDSKWYDKDRDMEKISELFPDIIFKIRGVGEGDGEEIDIWEEVYNDGERIVRREAKVVYPDTEDVVMMLRSGKVVENIG